MTDAVAVDDTPAVTSTSPGSVDAPSMVETIHGLIADPVGGPRLQQLLHNKLRQLISRLTDDEFNASTNFGRDELMRRLAAYEQLVSDLAPAFALAGYWAPREVARVFAGSIPSIVTARDRRGGITAWLDLYAYPALLLLYSFGLGAVHGRRYDNLACVLSEPIADRLGALHPAALELNNASVIEHAVAQTLFVEPRRFTPVSDWLNTVTRPWLANVILSDEAFDRTFDEYELILGLAHWKPGNEASGSWAPTGRFTWRGRLGNGVAATVFAEIERNPAKSPLVGTLFDTDEELAEAAKRHAELVASITRRSW